MRYIILAAISSLNLSSEVLTVCTSGCTFTGLQSALDQVRPGDTIQLKPTERYVGSFRIAGRPGNAPILLTCDTSILPKGQRIPENSPNVCTLETDGFRGLTLQAHHFTVPRLESGTDLIANTVTMEFNYSMPPTSGSNMECSIIGAGRLPSPLIEGQTYYVTRDYYEARFFSSSTGSLVDLVDSGSGRMACSQTDRVQNWTIEHIRFRQTNLMPDNPYDGAFFVGYEGEGPHSMPRNITFRHVIASGDRTRISQLRRIMWVAAENVVVEDSWLGIAGEPGYDSQVVSVRACAGYCRFENNAIINGTIGFLTGGGSFAGNVEHISGVELLRNYIYKEPDYLWTQGTGAPFKPALEGAVYYRSDIPGSSCQTPLKCYVRSGGAWIPTSTARFRPSSRGEKAAIEFKGCKDCRIEGNVVRNVYAGSDAGNMYCILLVRSSQNGPTDRLENIIVRNNRCIDTYSGIAISDDDPALFTTTSPNNIIVQNNGFLGIGNLALSASTGCGDYHARSIYLQAGIRTGLIEKNSFRRDRLGCSYFPLLFQPSPDLKRSEITIRSNLLPVNSSGYGTVFADYVNCDTLSQQYIVPARITNIGVYGNADGRADPYAHTCIPRAWVRSEEEVQFSSLNDLALSRTSPFSRQNNNPIQLSHDGTDLGVDANELNNATRGVLEGIIGNDGARKVRR